MERVKHLAHNEHLQPYLTAADFSRAAQVHPENVFLRRPSITSMVGYEGPLSQAPHGLYWVVANDGTWEIGLRVGD
jgi:hypothetical protein